MTDLFSVLCLLLCSKRSPGSRIVRRSPCSSSVSPVQSLTFDWLSMVHAEPNVHALFSMIADTRPYMGMELHNVPNR